MLITFGPNVDPHLTEDLKDMTTSTTGILKTPG